MFIPYKTIIKNCKKDKLRNIKRIGILGAGPAGLFVLKRLIECNEPNLYIEIFEKKAQAGAGMPYSKEGANDEHITNVSGNEIPEFVTSVSDWIQTVPGEILNRFYIDPKNFNHYKVLPRLLLGLYLEAQFELLMQQAKKAGIRVELHLNTVVADIIDHPRKKIVTVKTEHGGSKEFEHVVICSGHHWPVKYEGKIPGYFESPYPPSKLAVKLNHPVAIKGASLTAIDAIRTLSRCNGSFSKDKEGRLRFKLAKGSEKFRLMMYSIDGLLPAVRFHLADTHLSHEAMLTEEEIAQNMLQNEGFLQLDFVFEKNFKQPLKDRTPVFYEKIKDMNMEAFVACMMELRQRIPPFQLLKAEYEEAEKSIKQEEPVHWKEMLAVLSYVMNYPAKYFSAEDMIRLQNVLMPLISVVIAFVPQSSVEEMFALYEAGVLDITAVKDSNAEQMHKGGAIIHYTDEANKNYSVYYQTYVDCIGQPHLSWKELPYKSMIAKKTVSPATLKFRNQEAGKKEMENKNDEVIKDKQGNYFLKVPGIKINDSFQVINDKNKNNERIYIMAVPFIGGYNPDYSGLDFCETASANIVMRMMKK